MPSRWRFDGFGVRLTFVERDIETDLAGDLEGLMLRENDTDFVGDGSHLEARQGMQR